MTDIRDKLYLTDTEVAKIHAWIAQNNFTFDRGHFMLFFDFCPIYDDRIFFNAVQDRHSHHLELRGIDVEDGADDTSKNHRICVENTTVELTLSDNAVEKFYALAQGSAEAHGEEDIEPSGYGLGFEIYKDYCHLYAESHFLETINNPTT
jgi:hypothetical protein